LLQAVAVKSLPFDHPVVQHVGLCDFCLADVNVLRHARKRRRTVAAVGGMVAAILIVIGVLATRHSGPSVSTPATQVATLDLRPFSALREDTAKTPNTTPVLPRENLRLSVVLPIGSETGQYEIRLMNDQLRVVQETTGNAQLQNGEIRLAAQLNLSGLAAGSYRLWIRRRDRSWRDYPLEIR